MSSFITTFWKALIAGFGFAVSMLIVFLITSQYMSRGGSDYVKGVDLEGKLFPSVTTVRFNDGRIIIHGSIENRSDETFENVSLATAVSENTQLIEDCVGNVAGPLKSKEKAQFVVNCQQKWKDLERTKLNVHVKPRGAVKFKAHNTSFNPDAQKQRAG